jgi:hypothetical protein
MWRLAWLGVPRPSKCVQSLQKKRPTSGLAGAGHFFVGLNAKARLLAGSLFISTSILDD